MNLSKSPPYRSPAFLKFCHELPLVSCCLCGARPASELHHFGDDGSMGRKASDNEVARVCSRCHRDTPHKRRALIKNGYMDILERFQNDALKLNRLYMEFLEG